MTQPRSRGGDARVATHAGSLTRARQSKALFFAAAGLSFLASISLFFTGDHERGIYVGLWVPSILAAGALLLAGESHD